MKKLSVLVLAVFLMLQCTVPSSAAESESFVLAENKFTANEVAYKYSGLDFSPVFNASYYLSRYVDLRNAFGSNSSQAFNHFINYGIKEGRQACSAFDINIYKANYSDLRKAFGNDNMSYVKHYLQFGIKEKRVANKLISGTQTTNTNTATTANSTYKYNGLDFSPVFNASYYLGMYSDLKKAFGSNSSQAFNHFISNGINEGRQACSTFSVSIYKANYADLRSAFGSNNMSYVMHYLQYGIKEKRVADKLISGSVITVTAEERLASELFNAMNAERRARGLKTLTRDSTLDYAASIRAREASSCWSHTRPDGTSYKTVSPAVGGENLAKGYTSGTDVSTAWVNHSGHKETMLAPYNKVGISVYWCPSGYCYAAEFGY